MIRATSESWKTEPIGRLTALTYEDEFTPGEFDRLSHGLIPEQMEDKWFIYFDGLSAFVHRSWTGEHVYSADFTRTGAGYTIGAASVSAGIARSELDPALLRFLLRGLILGQDVPFPIPQSVSAEEQAVFQHALVGRQVASTSLVAGPSAWSRIRSSLSRLVRRRA